VKIGSTVRPGRVIEKKGQDSHKSHKDVIISPTCGEAPTEPICTEICAVVAVPDVITCAQFWTESFRSLRFYRG